MAEINSIDAFVGKRLRFKRKEHKLSLEALAEQLSVSMQQLQKYEKGQTRISASQLFTVGGILGVEPGYFFEGIHRAENSVANNAGTISQSRKPINILMVEDSPADEFILRKALDESGEPMNIFCVHDGNQVLDLLRGNIAYEHFPRPDIILMDLNIPKVPGIEVLTTIKKDRTLNDIPVVVITNSVDAKEMLNIYKHQAAGYVCKNFNYDAFAENVHHLLHYWAKVVALPNTSIAAQPA